MGKWYRSYLKAFDKSVEALDEAVIQNVRCKLASFSKIEPVVSIVVIAYNEERNILGCLWSLADQVTTQPTELIVVNNNSTDRTESILQKLDITYHNEPNQGPGFARQCGLNHAKGKYILCVDGDTLYPATYAQTHFDALNRSGVVATFSLWSFLYKNWRERLFFLWYEGMRDIYLNLQYIKRPELCVRGMVFSFRIALGREVGFRTDIKRGEDGSMALGLKAYGRIIFIRSYKARALTGQHTIAADGSLFRSFYVRLCKGVRSIGGLFSKKDAYKDEDTNMIDKFS